MNKSYKRDVQVLIKMAKNIDDTRKVLIDFKCNKTNLKCNKYALDLCAFYLAQFGEKVKLLTDNTITELESVVDLGTMKYFRNKIDHDYESVNADLLVAYVYKLVSTEVELKIAERILYCRQHSK